ncbi:trehalose-phosphatase [Actinomadura parmotrematis]|uniref:Trehalose 6-phosphate phosphatase n=1 Tax=Actinomadura parmotrematis TaxID=2864039 RepID=A0ABS7FVS1_9ACTN|nr:trehalose-phosphatase [Actinomadura parmotrematis]MBW8484270.1 trehalose-phosphatase [Actinomadura parmotrematis]
MAELIALAASTRERARDTGLFFDFDGTLAPIQEDPAAVEPVPGVLPALTALAGLVRTTAVVSARPVDFLASRFAAVPGLALYGLYGLERSLDGEVRTLPAVVPWRSTTARLVERARAELDPDLLVEDKGLSMALHYRTAPHLQHVAESWVRDAAARTGARLEIGPMTAELIPPMTPDKGSVLADAVQGLRCAWYFGDGRPDLAAFTALERRAGRDPDFLGVRVAVANPETGDTLRADADLVVDGPAAMPGTLRALVEGLTVHQRRGDT